MRTVKVEGNLTYWVAFNLVLAEKLGLARKIIQHFSSVGDLFKARAADFLALGVEKEIAELLSSPKVLERANKEIDWCRKKGYAILTVEDSAYPGCLREIFDPPFVLYCAGRVEVLDKASVSIVGARKPNPYGRAVTEKIAQDLASRGLVVVSGLARGIDSMAHWGALKGGETVAVLGSGLGNIYPKENRDLFEKIVERGAVVSEYPSNSKPLGFHFPLRNRIIAGLSLALLVVEGTLKSGSLISARLALEQNREVMAVPGNTTSELSRGTNWLIKTGAKLVESWSDVVEELPLPDKERLLNQKEEGEERATVLAGDERRLFDLLSPDSLTHIDEIVEKTDWSVSETLFLLLNLELKGLVFQSPGKHYQRNL